MSRPRKIKSTPADCRAFDKEPDNLAAIARQFQINILRVDPLGDEPLACMLGPIFLKRATADEKQEVGWLFAQALETTTAEQLEKFFARVVVMKKNAEQPHRHAFAYFGYVRFIEENGREPSKFELKKYLLARRENFKDLPPAEDGKAWTRVWREAGLFTLPDKVGTKP